MKIVTAMRKELEFKQDLLLKVGRDEENFDVEEKNIRL